MFCVYVEQIMMELYYSCSIYIFGTFETLPSIQSQTRTLLFQQQQQKKLIFGKCRCSTRVTRICHLYFSTQIRGRKCDVFVIPSLLYICAMNDHRLCNYCTDRQCAQLLCRPRINQIVVHKYLPFQSFNGPKTIIGPPHFGDEDKQTLEFVITAGRIPQKT